MPRTGNIPDLAKETYILRTKEKILEMIRQRYHENYASDVPLSVLESDMSKMVDYKIKTSTLKLVLDPSYLKGLDLFTTVALCKLLHVDIGSVLDPEIGMQDMRTVPEEEPLNMHIRQLDDPLYLTTVYGYYYAPDGTKKPDSLERFTMTVNKLPNRTEATLTLYQNSFESKDELRSLYGFPYVANNQFVYTVFMNHAVGDVIILAYDYEHYRTLREGRGIYFRKGILLCQARDSQALIAQNCIFFDHELPPESLETAKGALYMKENFIHVTRENMNRIIETSEGQDKEDLEYLMKYYGKDLKKRTESVVTVPLNIIEQAKDDRLDIPRIVHALLLLQKDPIDPMRLIYKKNQMISHYFRDL